MPKTAPTEKPVNLGRHSHQCTICAHPRREEIEQDFIGWGSTAEIAAQFDVSRDSVYRHARAMGLFPKRQRNLKASLEKIIERAGSVDVNAAAVVSAVSAYARINSAGQWIERTERVDMNKLFERMTREELEKYARTGHLPGWFTSVVGATEEEGHEDGNGR